MTFIYIYICLRFEQAEHVGPASYAGRRETSIDVLARRIVVHHVQADLVASTLFFNQQQQNYIMSQLMCFDAECSNLDDFFHLRIRI